MRGRGEQMTFPLPSSLPFPGQRRNAAGLLRFQICNLTKSLLEMLQTFSRSYCVGTTLHSLKCETEEATLSNRRTKKETKGKQKGSGYRTASAAKKDKTAISLISTGHFLIKICIFTFDFKV